MTDLIDSGLRRLAQTDASRVALVDREERLTYADLEDRCRALWDWTGQKEIAPGSPVALHFEDRKALVVTLVALVRAGIPSIVLDPADPGERHRDICLQAGVTAILCDQLSTSSSTERRLQLDPFSLTSNTSCSLPVPDPSDAAYLVATSGSTGRPKCVRMPHRALAPLLRHEQDRYVDAPPPVVLQCAAPGFDVFFQEVFVTLNAGGRLVLCAEDTRRRPALMLRAAAACDATRLFMTPSQLQTLALAADREGHLPLNLKEITSAGEALTLTPAIRRLFDRLPDTHLVNQYGPCETHVVTEFSLSPPVSQAGERVPIGRPIDPSTVELRDKDGGTIEGAGTGELIVSAPCVADGYLTDGRLAPFPQGEAGAIYRTGDRVRRDETGTLHFLGRMDDQMLVRGRRVEPGEIETALLACEGVGAAAVRHFQPPQGPPFLTAYVCGETPATHLSYDQLNSFTAAHLPAGLRPQRWVILTELPRTSSGKLDRAALPDPDLGDAECSKVSAEEQAVANIIADVLQLDHVPVTADFIELGGDSLRAGLLLDRLTASFGRAFGFDLLVDKRTARDIAAIIPELPRLPEADLQSTEASTLSGLQLAYLFARDPEVELGGFAAGICFEAVLPAFDLPRAQAAVDRLLARHDWLLCGVDRDGRRTRQGPSPVLTIEDLSGLRDATLAHQEEKLRLQVASLETAPTSAPLFRFALARLPKGKTRLFGFFDLLLGDFATLQALSRELLGLYNGDSASRDTAAPVSADAPSPILTDQKTIAEIIPLPPAPALPRRSGTPSIVPGSFCRRQGFLSRSRWLTIKTRAARYNVTPTAVLSSLYALVLAHWSETPHFSLNMPGSTPMTGAPSVGDRSFAAVVPFDLRKPKAFHERIRDTQTQVWRALTQARRPDASRARFGETGLLPVIFTSLLGYELDVAEAALLGWGPFAANGHVQTPQVLIDHHTGELLGALHYNWDVVDGAFPDGLIGKMFTAYSKALELISDEDSDWTAPLSPENFAPSIKELTSTSDGKAVQPGVLRTDGQADLVTPAASFSSAKLGDSIQELTLCLKTLGAGKGDLVAILAPKGAEQIIAVLAVVATGAAYLPMDTNWPDQRRQAVLNDAGARLLVKVSSGRIEVDALRTSGKAADLAPQATDQITPSDLAYVIYTSGSTGTPKGVAMSHGAAATTIEAVINRLDLTADDTIAAISNLAFDLSVFDIFACQKTGTCLALPDDATLKSPSNLAAFLTDHKVTIWNSAPLAMEALASYLEANRMTLPTSLRAVLLSGDWIPRALPGRLRALSAGPLRVISLGGATEAGIWSVWHDIEADDPGPGWNSIPYGKALEHQSALVLDQALCPRPDLVAGPLFIGGAALAEGYWKQPALTDRAFIRHPKTGERLYRTGDIARRHPDGTLELLGREDRQIKLLGHRLEPAEIEAVAASHPDVAAAIVSPQKEGGQTTGLDVAVKPRGQPAVTLERDVEDRLNAWLPANMARVNVHLIDEIPLTENGKRDLTALLTSGKPPSETGVRKSDQDLLSVILAECRHLGATAGLTSTTSFFELGLTSLDLLRLRDHLRTACRITVPISEFFAHPSPAALAERMARQDLPRPSVPFRSHHPSPRGRDIAIVGLACRMPGAGAAEDFWSLLAHGKDGVTRFDTGGLHAAEQERTDPDHPDYVPARPIAPGLEDFDPEFFGVPAFEAERMDPQHRILLDLAWEALEDAGLPPRQLPNTGVFAGCNESAYLARRRIETASEVAEGMALRVATDRDYVSTRLSYVLGLEGPSLTVQTACSSSLVAVHLAVQSLLLGECDAALAGGVALQVPHRTGYLWQAGGYSSRSGVCRPFDARADGTLFGSGGGLVVLRPLDAALADGDRIYAVIKGSAVGNDGAAKPGFTAPSVAGQARTVAAALSVSGVPADKIGALEAHGTGTPLGDPIEIAALSEAFHNAGGARNIALGSVKGNIGHLDAAAGIAGLIKLVLARANGIVPASLNFQTPNPEIDFAASPFHVNTRARPWPARQPFGGINSLGIGGTNAHVIIGPAPDKTASEDTQDRRPDHETGPALLVLSSRTQDGLKPLAQRWSRWLAGPGRDHKPQEIAAAALNRRSEGPYRLALAGQSPQDWAGALAAFADTDAGAKSASGSGPASLPGVQPLPRTPRSVAFGQEGKAPVWIFSGQGGQSAGMAASLRHAAGSGPALETFLAALPDDLQPGLIAELLFGTGDPEEMHAALARPAPALLAHVAWQCAQTAFWRAHGLKPAAVLGVSVGEIAAAEAAGVFGLEGAAQTAANRARALEQTPSHGAMAVIARDAAGTEDLINRTQPGALDSQALWIAVRAGPESTVIAGQSPAMQQLEASLAETGLQLRPIACGGIASHGKAVEDAARIIAAQPAAAASPPDIPFQATTSGWTGTDRIPDFSAAYWAGNLAKPVDLGAALTRLIKSGHTDFLEIASRSQSVHTLDAIARAEGASLTLRQSASADTPHLTRLATLATFIPNKLANPVSNMENATRTRHIDIPKTPRQNRRFWLDDTPAFKEEPRPLNDTLAGRQLDSPALTARVFETRVSRNTAWLRDHIVDGEPLLPFSAILSILQSAVPGKALHDVHQEAPLSLTDQETTLQTVLQKDGRIEIFARPSKDGAPWQRIASARTGPVPAHVHSVLSDPLAGGTQAVFDNGWIQNALDKVGLTFGGDYQRLTRLERRPGGTLVGRLRSKYPAGKAPWPSEIDAAIVAAAFQSGDDPINLCSGYPVGAETFWCQSNAEVATCRVDAAAKSEAGAPVSRNVSLFNPSGRLIGQLLGLTFEPIRLTSNGSPFRTLHWHAEPETPDNAPRPAFEVTGRSHAAAVLRQSPQPPERGTPDAQILIDVSALEGGSAADICARFTAHLEALTSRSDPPKLVVATLGAVAIKDTERSDPDQAALWGAVRSIMAEHPELAPSLIDLDAKDMEGSAAGLLARLGPSLPAQSALRDGVLYLPRLERRFANGSSPFKARGSYLVTGGFGGLGPHLARFLLKAGAERIVLCGPRLHADAQARIAELCPRDGTVETVVADVRDQTGMQAVLSGLPDLAGIVHGALSLKDGVAAGMTKDAFQTALGPKIDGARVLDALSRDLPLDHFLLFSSVTGTLGARGQANYAAACAAVDALAENRRRDGLPGISIAFGPWIYAGSPSEKWENHGLYETLTTETGLKRIGQVLGSGAAGHILAADVAIDKFPAWAPISPSGRSVRREVDDPCKELAHMLARRLRVSADTLPADRSLAGMGLDSLAVLEFRNEIAQELGIVLPPRDLIAAPNLAAIAALLEHNEPPVKQIETGIDELDIDTMDDAEVEAMLARLLTTEGAAR